VRGCAGCVGDDTRGPLAAEVPGLSPVMMLLGHAFNNMGGVSPRMASGSRPSTARFDPLTTRETGRGAPRAKAVSANGGAALRCAPLQWWREDDYCRGSVRRGDRSDELAAG
jgi:hypothetical protein